MSITAAIRDIFVSFYPGFQPIDGGQLGQLADFVTSATGSGPITALAGGGLSGTTPVISKTWNRVSVCVTNNDSVVLPLAIPGRRVFIDNDGAATLAVFSQTQNPNNPTVASPAGAADLVVAHNGLTGAAAASQTQLTTVGAWYICTTMGYWKQVLGT